MVPPSPISPSGVESPSRRDELTALRAIWVSIRTRTGRTVVIEGERGVGKSQLVHDLARHVSNGKRAATVLQAGADAAARAAPLLVARELFAPIRDAVGLAGASERALADLSVLVPALRDRFAHLPQPSSDIAALRNAIVEAIDAVADEAPVLIIIDDFDRCDVPTQQLILALGERSLRSVLVVVTTALGAWSSLPGPTNVHGPDDVHRITLHASVEKATPPSEERGRGRRWRRWAPVAIAAAGTLAATAAVTRNRGPDGDPVGTRRRVVVTVFENRTRDPQLDALGRIAADWLTEGAARTGLVSVSQPILDAGGDDASAGSGGQHVRLRRLARASKADLIVLGAYAASDDSLRFEAEIINAQTGERLGAVAIVGTARGTPLEGIERLRQKTLAALAPWIDERLTAAARLQSVPPTYESYLAFAGGLDRFYARDPTAAENFARAYALDTTFTLPLLFEALTRNGLTQYAAADSLLRLLRPRRFRLAVYDRYLFDILAASLRGDAAAAYESARAAAEAAPGSYAATMLPGLAIGYNRPKEALSLLLPADSLHGEPSRLASYWAMVESGQHMVGDFDGELSSGRLVRHRFPHDPRYLHYEVRALAALGRLRELDAVLVESLEYRSIPGWGPPGLRAHITASDELRAHGRDSASRAVLERAVAYYLPSRSAAFAGTRHPFDLARALYQLGRLDEARRIVDRLANDAGPRILTEFELRTLTGYVAAAQRDSVTVHEIDRWLREMTDPYIHGANTEARARLAALLGRREEAVRLLRDANAEGQGFAVGYHAQFEFATLRGFEPFEEWLRPKD